MRIGLYGLPSAGKTFILDDVKDFEVLEGSRLLKKMAPDFYELPSSQQEQVRRKLAAELRKKDRFLMDGHYSFGQEVVFTEEDGELYDVFLYLYTEPSILKKRMGHSLKNCHYLKFDIEQWQRLELNSLRRYCHVHKKDFYVMDNPAEGYFPDIRIVLDFLGSIADGYSCLSFARQCADDILRNLRGKEIILTDGDKTLMMEDSSTALGYRTTIFDGNFYTGFQSWRHSKEMADFLEGMESSGCAWEKEEMQWNQKIIGRIHKPCVILTSGYGGIWKKISDQLGMMCFYGSQMSAETKYYIVKFLQEAGVEVTAYGDSMNDYYMLKQADHGYLVLKQDGTFSRSLKGKNMEGISFV